MEGKSVSASAIFDYEIAIDFDDLNDEFCYEGRFMGIVNSLALTVARRHAEKPCIVSSIDSIRFKQKVIHGDILLCFASVNRTWRSSMEVGVKVIAEDFRSLEQKDVLSAYFTLTALDEDNCLEIVPVIPETSDQLRRFHEATLRHQNRFKEELAGTP